MAKIPENRPVTPHWLSCGNQSLYHDVIVGSGPELFWEVLERFCRDAAMFQKSSVIKCRDSFLFIGLHSPDAKHQVQSKSWKSLKCTKRRWVIMLHNWVIGYPEGLLPGQPGCLPSATFYTFTQRRESRPFTLSHSITPQKGALEKGCLCFLS